MTVKIEKRIKGYSVRQPGEAISHQQQLPKVHSSPTEADRRLVLTAVSTPLANSLRWASRPYDPDGHSSRTYMVKAPEGKFSVHVVHADNGSPETGEPFEVWVGDGAPRGLKALCKSLSMDMRSLDRGWLKTKLESLFGTPGEPFDMTLPGGILVRVPSAVAAFARIVHARCEQLGAFTDNKLSATPVLDALMSRKEPKADGTGTVAWMVPIRNTGFGDDFELVVKEVVTPEGRIVPQSVWLTGRKFPRSLEGLAISLSFDLRVNDVQWSVLKLQQLVDLDEGVKGGDSFWACVPGTEKSASFPSLAAYIATLILYRLKVLGLVDDARKPTAPTGVVSLEVVRSQPTQSQTDCVQILGALCNDCGAYAVVPTDGSCLCCKACGASKC